MNSEVYRQNGPEPKRVGRRAFLRGTAATTATLALGGLVDSDSQAPRSSPETALTRVKKFESAKGEELLSYEEARSVLVPNLAELFVQSTNSSKTVEEMVQNTFIVRGDYPSDDAKQKAYIDALVGQTDFSADPILRQFRLDYPDLKMTNEEIQHFVLSMSSDPLGWNADGKVFIAFDRLNKQNTLIQPWYSNHPIQLYAFDGDDDAVPCSIPSPAIKFRSTYLHELTHFDAEANIMPIEQELLDAYQNASQSPYGNPVKFTEGKKLAFIIATTNDKNISDGNNQFNEFVTDYLASRISIEQGLPYTLGYYGSNSPHEYSNFERVLHQSGISDKQLRQYNKVSDIKGFLLQVAHNAEEKQFKNDQEALAFGAGLFYVSFNLNAGTRWQYFSPYYHDLKLQQYEYVDRSQFTPSDPSPVDSYLHQRIFYGNALGCVTP